MSITASGVMELITFYVNELVVMSALPVSLRDKDDSWSQFIDSKFDITYFFCNLKNACRNAALISDSDILNAEIHF